MLNVPTSELIDEIVALEMLALLVLIELAVRAPAVKGPVKISSVVRCETNPFTTFKVPNVPAGDPIGPDTFRLVKLPVVAPIVEIDALVAIIKSVLTVVAFRAPAEVCVDEILPVLILVAWRVETPDRVEKIPLGAWTWPFTPVTVRLVLAETVPDVMVLPTRELVEILDVLAIEIVERFPMLAWIVESELVEIDEMFATPIVKEPVESVLAFKVSQVITELEIVDTNDETNVVTVKVEATILFAFILDVWTFPEFTRLLVLKDEMNPTGL